MNSNHTIIDLNKVSYANFFYESYSCGLTSTRRTKPSRPTVHGIPVSADTVLGRNETMLSLAERRGLLDTWTPKLVLHLSNGHPITYTGAKAISIYNAYKDKIFNKAKNNK